eukprot:8619_1
MALLSSFGDMQNAKQLVTEFPAYNTNKKCNWDIYQYAHGAPGHIGLVFVNQNHERILFLVELGLPRNSIWDLIIPGRNIKIIPLFQRLNHMPENISNEPKMGVIKNKSILDIETAANDCIKSWHKYSVIFFNCRHFVPRLISILNDKDPNDNTKYWFYATGILIAGSLVTKIGEMIFSVLKNGTSDKIWFYRFTVINKLFRISHRVWRFGLFGFGLYGIGQIIHQRHHANDSVTVRRIKSCIHYLLLGSLPLYCVKYGRKMIWKIQWDLNKINAANYAQSLPELSLGTWFNEKIVQKVSINENFIAFACMSVYLIYQIWPTSK